MSSLREIRPTLALALPIIVGQVGQMLMGVLDGVMIGHAGTVPLAASAFGTTVFGVFFTLAIGVMVPVSIFVARSRGAGRPSEAAEYLRHGVALALAAGALETLAMAALSTQLRRFGQPPEVLAIVRPFFLLLAGSLTPVLIYLALRQFAEAMGHPWAPMFIILAGVGLNAVLNWIFIFGHLGAPAMGLSGAGVATLIARTVATLAIFLWLRRDPAVRAAWPVRWWGAYSMARFREILRLGLPAAGMLLFEGAAFSCSAVMMGWLGSVPLAAHQIALSCASLSFMFPLGIAIATGMRLSHAVGAGEHARLRPLAKSSLALGLGAMVVFGLAFEFGGREIATWFVGDPAVIALAAHLFAVAAVFQLFDGTQVISASALRAIGDARMPLVITFVGYALVALPISYFTGIRGSLGAVGIWVGLACGLTVVAILLASRFAWKTRHESAVRKFGLRVPD